MLINVTFPGKRNVIKKEAEMVHSSPCDRNTAHVECKNKSHTSNNEGNWNLPQIIHKVPDEQTGRARNTGTASRIGQCLRQFEKY